MRNGFSLVELSIVLVILGLLTGGILAGQSLIRASELRSVTNEYSRYITALQTFRDKYFALPGDMSNATSFWGKDNTNCAGDLGSVGTPGACNGNGDGVIDPAAAASVRGERFQIWKQLALAGLIEGSYSGIAGTGGNNHTVFATNSPPSKLGNAGWGVSNLNQTATASTTIFQIDFGNHFQFGAQSTTAGPTVIVLKPEELWNIDTKLDDGRPGNGKVIAQGIDTCTTATAGTQLNADYRLDNSAVACAIRFPKAI